MLERRSEELKLLRQRYGELECGPDGEWIVISSFLLPTGWLFKTTRLLILVPPGYPMTPPDNFYVELGLRLASGAQPASFSEPVSQLGQNWGQFSYHIEPGDWNPAVDIVSSHNLLTFMLGVEGRLSELN